MLPLNIWSGILLGSLSATVSAASLHRTTTARQQVCNGNADFCNRKYSDVSLIGTHDSAFSGSLLDPRVNQELNVSQQLDAGIRFIQAQTHLDDDSVLSMCHTSCLELNAGTLQTYLSTVKTWVDANPNDFLTMLLVNGDNVAVSTFADVFSSVGLDQVAFVPSTSPNMLAMGDWPTYSELLADGKRIVIFLDSGANEANVPYVLDEFTYFFETPYDTTDANFAECTLDRPSGGDPSTRMYIVNHFLDENLFEGILIPDNADDYQTNSATGTGSIGAQADLCTSTYNRVPNFVLVDMFDRGDVFTAQNTLNGL